MKFIIWNIESFIKYSISISKVTLVDLASIVLFNVNHMILWKWYKFTSTPHITTTCVWVSVTSSRIKFCWWIETKVLPSRAVLFKFINVFYMLYSASVLTLRSLLSTGFFLILYLRISSQYTAWFLVLLWWKLILLLLLVLFWCFLIHRFCAYSYSAFGLYFKRYLFGIIIYRYDYTSISFVL